MARKPATDGLGIDTYTARRDFSKTKEPPAGAAHESTAPIFVVQKHDATRLHWDFRLEQDGVLWSWAVPKGPSMDPSDKRLAVRVEDHPLDYAHFEGTIPEGQYGAGTVEIWDQGTWEAIEDDPVAARDRGELKFILRGARLNGGFVLVRIKPRQKERQETWLLIKEHDDQEEEGTGADQLETRPGPVRRRGKKTGAAEDRPRGAVAGPLPTAQAPQLASLAPSAPEGPNWLSEIKYDGYRLLAFIEGGAARLLSRNGVDWSERLPHLSAALAALPVETALVDGEMVAVDPDGRTNFGRLKAALSEQQDSQLIFFAFDLLHLNGWDFRPCRLIDRKSSLQALGGWNARVRYSDHVENQADSFHHTACDHRLEGIICKQADAPYRAGRGRTWLKVKCEGREEFVILGWTPHKDQPASVGALQVGFYDQSGQLFYAGGVGTGFSEAERADLGRRLVPLAVAGRPQLVAGPEAIARGVQWVQAELIAEVRYLTFTEAGRLRHATYLGLREDKIARDVVRDPPTGESDQGTDVIPAAGPSPKQSAKIVVINRSRGSRLTHPDKPLWPDLTKRDLADYWHSVAAVALPGIAGRPLALVRCPDGIDGQHFFQKHAMPGFPDALRAGSADGAPYIVLDHEDGLQAAAQMAAIELHSWGSAEPDPLHPDRVVFDLDPAEGVGMDQIAAAAREVRARLNALGLTGFCRTTGGKGLHVVAPLVPAADWDTTHRWCRAFAEAMVADAPDRYVAQVKKSLRIDKILVDWLRNGLGATAIASFSPRARPAAGVATPLAWREVTASLNPGALNLRTVPARLARLRNDPWAAFTTAAVELPERSN